MNRQNIVWLVGLVLLLAGCSVQQPPVAVQPTATLRPTQTATLRPPRPIISRPTAAPTATPLANSSLLPDAEIAFIHESAAGKAVGVTSRDGQMTRQLVPPHATRHSALLDWSPDGQWLSIVLGPQWWLFARDGSPGQAMSIDRSLGTMSRPAWSPDSTRLAFSQVTADRTSTTLTVLDVSTAQRGLYPVDTFEAETFSSAPVWSPNGTTIAVQQTSPEPAQSALVLLDVAGGQITTHIGTQPRTFSGMLLWSPDSQRLVSVNRSSTSLFTPTDHSVVTSSDCLGSEVNHVNWSPDSQWVAHHRSYNGRYAHGFVCLMSLAGETIRISVGGNASNPVWSADSQSLMLAVTTLPENAAFPDAPPRAPDPRLLRFDLATRRLARITALPQGTGAVVGWIHPSPDQQAIAIAYPRLDPILTLVDPTTAVSTTSPLSVALKYTPRPFLSWSGDADQLFFVTTVTSDDPKQHAGHIYRYDLQDNSFTRLVETGEIVAWTVAPEIQAQATVPTATSTATPTATPTPSPTALPTALPTPRPTSAVPPDQSIRSTDWEALIGVQNTPLPHYLLDRIAYADLDGDGVEEAILPYYSGGTAGILYFSIFCQTASGPVEVGRVDGYKAGIDLQDGYLIRTTTVYAGWEANCCPSGLLLTGYTLRGAVLEPVAEWRMGDIVMVRDVLSWYFSS